MTVYVLDHYYLFITLLVTVGYQLFGFFVAWTFQFDKITGELPSNISILLRTVYTQLLLLTKILLVVCPNP